MRALILYLPDGPGCRRRVAQLREELRWRRFDVEVEPADPAARRAVDGYAVVVLAFAALGVPRVGVAPLGRLGAVIDSLQGLDGAAVALMSMSALGKAGALRRLTRTVEAAGGRVVAARSVALLGPPGAVVDLAAECMVRVPR